MEDETREQMRERMQKVAGEFLAKLQEVTLANMEKQGVGEYVEHGASLADLTAVIKAIPKPPITELRVTPADYVAIKTLPPSRESVWGSNLAPPPYSIPVIIDSSAPSLEDQLKALKENNE